MSDANDESRSHSPETQSPNTGGGKFVRLVLIAAFVVLAYYGVTGGIRWYVTSQIEKSAGAPMPDFELLDLSGRKWTAADLRGKTTVLNFFRSQCHSCDKERPVIRQFFAERDKEKVQVVGVMMDRVVAGISEELTARTLARFGYEHPILMADKAFVDAFHGAGWAHVTPVTSIVDAKGRIVRALRNHQTVETLRSATQ